MENKYLRIRESAEVSIALTDSQFDQLNQASNDLRSDKEYWRSRMSLQDDRYLELTDISEDARAIFVAKAADGHYRVKVHNAIGVIGLGGLTILVEPKIPLDHFSYIAQRAILRDVRASKSKALMAAGDSFFEVLASWFLTELESMLRKGLPRDYYAASGDLAYARGRVLPIPTVSRWLKGRAEVHAEFEEFDEDNSTNRVIKSALSCIATSNSLHQDIKKRARRSFLTMRDVGAMSLVDVEDILSGRKSKGSPVLEYALYILRGMGLSLSEGEVSSRTFLIPTPALMESGLREILRAGLAPVAVEKRAIRLGDTWLSVTPDALISRPPFTADVKYKITKQGWQRADLAQAVLFAAAFYSDLGVVLSFSSSESVKLPAVPVGDLRVASVTWPVSENWTPNQSEQLVVEDFKKLIAGKKTSVPAIVASLQ